MSIVEDHLIATVLDVEAELVETQALLIWYRDLACAAMAMQAELSKQLDTARATNATLIDELRAARIGAAA